MTYVREDSVESYLVDRCKALGGVAVKQTWPGRRGAPDRMCLFPALMFMVETKPPKGYGLKAWQERAHGMLIRSGIAVYTAYTRAEVDEVLKSEGLE